MEEKEALLESNKQKTSASFKTISCIIAIAAFEKATTFGLSANMILYLENEYHIGLVTGTNIIILWTAACNFLPVLGAFLADSSVGRYPMIAFGSIVGLMGTTLLWLTTMIPQARPPLCGDSTTQCQSSTTFQVVFLCFSLGLTSIGAGSIRSVSMAFGADQFFKRYNEEKSLAALQSYFGWFLNKACIVGDPQRYLTAERDIQDSWSLCSVDQVEELATRIVGQPFYFTSKLKMGIGILLSILFMVVLVFIENIRRGIAIEQGFAENPGAVVNMSALWLILPYCLIGIGEALNSVGQYEFFYSEFPKSMSSIASTLRDLSLSAGGLVATFMLNIIDQVTSRGGKPSWISSLQMK